jgi:YidC/Oxa1 family membrane protein insertase
MDIRRTIIFAGLAVSSYMLFLNWNQDYGQVPVPESAQQQPALSASDAPVPVQETSVPDVPGSNLEAPDISSLAEAPMVATPQITTGELIEVKTDTLLVEIDPVGGEIVSVRLPEYPISIEQKDIPFTLLDKSSVRTYVAQSGLIGQDGLDSGDGPARFSSVATSYEMGSNETLEIILTAQTDRGRVEKVFGFQRGTYLIDVKYRIHNQSDSPWQQVFYAQLKRDDSPDPSASSAMGMQSYLGAALTTSENRYEKISFSDLEDDGYKSKQTGGWAAILQHYFLAAWVPDQQASHTYNGRYFNDNYIFGFYDAPLVVPAGAVGETGAKLYVGPKIQDELAEVATNLDLTVDYGWLWWIAQPLFIALSFFHSLVGNWGVAIILLTICIKILFFYPSAMSYRSMANMRKVAPKMQELKEKHGDNREKLGQDMMKLYRDEKINPLGGCLPMLIQMPVFIALYWVLMESVELRQAPFALWIEDMSVLDPYFVLPLIMGVSMYIQMQLNPTPPDPMQARVMQFMPVIFTVFFLWFPAGLVLYWVVNNILSIAQQYVITKQIEKAP